MRRLTALVVGSVMLAAAATALGGPAATNPNGDFAVLDVGISPPVAGTARVPRGVGVDFDLFTGNRVNGAAASVIASTAVKFNNGFTYNGKAFPACTLNTKALSTCSHASQIGTGTAEAAVVGAATAFVPATVAAYNGKPTAGSTSPTLIVIASLGGKPSAEIDFKVTQQRHGAFGLTFTEIPFPGPITYDITKFSLTIPDRAVKRHIKGKKVAVHLITAPTTCHGSWQFAEVNTYMGGAPSTTATDSQSCTRH